MYTSFWLIKLLRVVCKMLREIKHFKLICHQVIGIFPIDLGHFLAGRNITDYETPLLQLAVGLGTQQGEVSLTAGAKGGLLDLSTS